MGVTARRRCPPSSIGQSMPIIKRNWDEFQVDRHKCIICGKPSRSHRGDKMHYLSAHADSARAERNWNIAMMHYEDGVAPVEVAKKFGISVGSVYTVLSNVAMFQHYYELDPIFLESPKVIPIEDRRRA